MVMSTGWPVVTYSLDMYYEFVCVFGPRDTEDTVPDLRGLLLVEAAIRIHRICICPVISSLLCLNKCALLTKEQTPFEALTTCSDNSVSKLGFRAYFDSHVFIKL